MSTCHTAALEQVALAIRLLLIVMGRSSAGSKKRGRPPKTAPKMAPAAAQQPVASPALFNTLPAAAMMAVPAADPRPEAKAMPPHPTPDPKVSAPVQPAVQSEALRQLPPASFQQLAATTGATTSIHASELPFPLLLPDQRPG